LSQRIVRDGGVQAGIASAVLSFNQIDLGAHTFLERRRAPPFTVVVVTIQPAGPSRRSWPESPHERGGTSVQ
jgi:hypothetical protein